jgi:hypothetical protein
MDYGLDERQVSLSTNFLFHMFHDVILLSRNVSRATDS